MKPGERLPREKIEELAYELAKAKTLQMVANTGFGEIVQADVTRTKAFFMLLDEFLIALTSENEAREEPETGFH